jgi:hypothetical protein
MITLQFVPYYEIADLSSPKRIRKLLQIVKENKILLLEGRLKKQEEAELIKKTMEEINDEFKGIELGVIYPDKKDADLFFRLKKHLINMLLGDRHGLTIIGPATIVKAIKQDPDKIQLLTSMSEKK